MEFKPALASDFDEAFYYIKNLWYYNDYDKTETKKLYLKTLSDENNYMFFGVENEEYHGFCHTIFFNTFWLSGLTCYISAIITNENERRKGYGTQILDEVKRIAKKKKCKGIILDSGIPRKEAHKFYETQGFERSCYGFDYILV